MESTPPETATTTRAPGCTPAARSASATELTSAFGNPFPPPPRAACRRQLTEGADPRQQQSRGAGRHERPPGVVSPEGVTATAARGADAPGLRRTRGHALEHDLAAGHVHADPVAVAELPLQHPPRQRVLHQALDGSLERSGTVHRVEALSRQKLLGPIGDLEFQLAPRKPPAEHP